VQDAVAYIEYTKAFRDLNNDLFKLAVNHFLPAANSDPAKLDIVPRANKITPRQYADKLIQNIGKGIGADIPLRYREAPEFDIWLQKAGGPPADASTTPSTQTSTTSSPNNCGVSSVGGSVVEIAQRELAAGISEDGGAYLKYTGGVQAAWCAYFVSWVFREAGKPFDPDPIPAVAGMLAYAREKGYFFAKNDPNFTPQPGDIAIYKEETGPYPSHVNIVISYDANAKTFTSIGGNESNRVKQASISMTSPSLTGFMRVP
jgi:cell wall-associated NlpC family hydrolase